MLLICPTCRSGLEVPDGTTAHVRCPSCQTVFSAVQVPPPPPPEPIPVEKVLTEPKQSRRAARILEDGDEASRRRPAVAKRLEKNDHGDRDEKDLDQEDEEGEPEEQLRPRRLDEGLSPEEKKVLADQFNRGSWGCHLIYIAMVLQAFALLITVLFLVRYTVTGSPSVSLIIIAGILGLLNWILGPIGLGLCLASRPVSGLYQCGTGAAIAMFIHGVLLLILLASSARGGGVMGVEGGVAIWGPMPTRLDSLTFYLTVLVYHNLLPVQAVGIVFTSITGLAEMVRLVFLLITLSYVARGAGDNELVYRCIRAAGIGSLGPLSLAIFMLLVVLTLVETGGIESQFGKIILLVAVMGIYAVLAGMLVPGLVAARETSEACEFPFQSQNFEIGDK